MELKKRKRQALEDYSRTLKKVSFLQIAVAVAPLIKKKIKVRKRGQRVKK
jgi:hypothetical protein